MGKGTKRPRKPSSRFPNAARRTAGNALPDPDYDDEIDAFHKQRDVVPLDVDDDSGGASEDELEQPVFDLEEEDNESGDDKMSSGDDDDEENDDNDSDGNGEDHVRHVPRLAEKIARQAKYLQQRIGGNNDESDDEDEQKEEKKAIWGRHRNMYFDGDNADFELLSSDEELLAEEEEALRMQRNKAKSYSLADFGLEDGDAVDGINLGKKEKSLKGVSGEEKGNLVSHAGGLVDENMLENYIKVNKDLDALSKEEQMDVVFSSAPELIGLMTELNEAIDQLRKLKELRSKMKGEKSVTEEGIHYMDLKRGLLLTYCQAIGFYFLLKSEGHPVRDHPVIARLVEIKNLLEKAKQIDENIPADTEDNEPSGRAIELDERTVAGDNDASVSDSGSESEPDIIGVLANTSELDQVQNCGKLLKETIREDQKPQLGPQSLEMLKVRAGLVEKLKKKGIYKRMEKKLNKSQNHASQNGNKLPKSLGDFDDEVADPRANGRISSSEPTKLSRLVNTKIKKTMNRISGEDDLPIRDDIGERRRKHELQVLARAGASAMDEDGLTDDLQDAGDVKMDSDNADESAESEDEFYREAKRQRASKLSAKSEINSRGPDESSIPSIDENGKRNITYQMDKNKGLTRMRKKLTKIPRKKYKVKHQKAVVRRKGQVRDMRKPEGPYGGEASGINTRVSRSVRFKN